MPKRKENSEIINLNQLALLPSTTVAQLVWLSGHPKNSSWDVRHPKKLKGNWGTSVLLASKGMQAAVQCIKRCMKSHKFAHKTPQNCLRLGLRPRPSWGSLRRSLGLPNRLERGYTPSTFRAYSMTATKHDGHKHDGHKP